MEQTFLIHTNDNGDLIFLYDDDLRFLFPQGKVEITRASDLIPTEEGRWQVQVIYPSKSYIMLPGEYETRAEALQAERNHIDGKVLA